MATDTPTDALFKEVSDSDNDVKEEEDKDVAAKKEKKLEKYKGLCKQLAEELKKYK